MITQTKYLELTGIGLRALQYRVEQKRIFVKRVGGVTHIIDPELSLTPKSRALLTEEAKTEIEALIIKAHSFRVKSIEESKKNLKQSPHCREVNEIIDMIQTRVKMWAKKGIKVKGFSRQTCYKKISDVSLLERKKRSDVFSVKNEILSQGETYEKLKALTAKLYSDDKRKLPSLRMLAKRVQMKARANEEYYELAAIPFSTLYDHIKKLHDRFGLKHVHLIENNYSEFNRKRPYVDGAFTKYINFMEWYAMDDHVMEVDGALVWNEYTQKWTKKKVYLWTIIEVKTLFPVAYMIQPEDFNADDIKLLMLMALTNMGKPVKGILMDNGLASSNKCNEFLDKLKINHDPGPAYEPLHKAVQERLFGFIKNEFCAQWSNYIGGGRSEVRHTTKKLSPEDCTYTVQEFISKFDDYMEGFYQTNIRTRTDNDEKKEICIREDFESRYMKFTKDHVKPVDLRKAYYQSTTKFFGYQQMLFGNKGVFNPDLQAPLHPVLCDRNYLVYYNPIDLREVDLYATEDILIQETGEYYAKGQYVATVFNQKFQTCPENQRTVNILRKKHAKNVRQTAESAIDIALAENVHAFNAELNVKGQILDTRKELTAKVQSQIEDASNVAATVDIPEHKKRGRKPTELEAGEFNSEISELDEICREGFGNENE